MRRCAKRVPSLLTYICIVPSVKKLGCLVSLVSVTFASVTFSKLSQMLRKSRTQDVRDFLQSIATGIEGLDCSKSSPYKLCTTSPIKLYHERVSRTGSVFPIFWGYKLIDKPVQNLYGLVLQSRPHSIPVAIYRTLCFHQELNSFLDPASRFPARSPPRRTNDARGDRTPCAPCAPRSLCEAPGPRPSGLVPPG